MKKKIMSQKVCIYARVSTADGKQNFDRQITDLKKIIIDQHGYLEHQIEVFSEMVSGYRNDDQAALHQIMDKIRFDKNYYKCLYVAEVNRIGRNPRHIRQIIDEITDCGVNIYIQDLNGFYLDDNGHRNNNTDLIMNILISRADQEAITTKMRIRSGLLNSVRNGRAGGTNNLPYGYMKNDDGLLVVNGEESHIIIEIFNLYSKGLGTKKISSILNERKIPTRYNKLFSDRDVKYWVGKRGVKTSRPKSFQIQHNFKRGKDIKWSDGQIWGIITNPIYIGKRRYKGGLYDCPRIVDDELFDNCQEIRKTKTMRISSKYVFLLSDLMECGLCKKNYVGRFKPHSHGEKVYKCSSTRYLGGTCGNMGVNIIQIESTLLHLIRTSADLIEMVNFSNEMKSLVQDEIHKLKFEIDVANTHLEEAQRVPVRILELYEHGSIPPEIVSKRYENAVKKIDNIEQSIKKYSRELKAKEKLIDSKAFSREEVLNRNISNREELKEYFRLFFNKIIVKKSDKDIIVLELFVDLVNGSVLKFILELGRDGLRRKKKEFKYVISDCILIDNGKGYTIVDTKFNEGSEVENIGKEVFNLLKSLNKIATIDNENFSKKIPIFKSFITVDPKEYVHFSEETE